MSTLGDVTTGDYIKSYQICGDEEWHKIYDAHFEDDGSIYVAIEGVKGRRRNPELPVEIMYR